MPNIIPLILLLKFLFLAIIISISLLIGSWFVYDFICKNIEDNKRSFAVSFTFNDSKKTLTDKLIDKIMLKLSDKYKTDLGAVIRDK